MTEKELRDDIIVKMLDYRDESHVDINSFCEAKNITFSSDKQKERVFDNLKDLGYIIDSLYDNSNGYIVMTSQGIDYAEELIAKKIILSLTVMKMLIMERLKSHTDLHKKSHYIQHKRTIKKLLIIV